MDEVPKVTTLSIEKGLILSESLSVQHRTDRWARAAEQRTATAAASHQKQSGTSDSMVSARRCCKWSRTHSESV